MFLNSSPKCPINRVYPVNWSSINQDSIVFSTDFFYSDRCHHRFTVTNPIHYSAAVSFDKQQTNKKEGVKNVVKKQKNKHTSKRHSYLFCHKKIIISLVKNNPSPRTQIKHACFLTYKREETSVTHKHTLQLP